MIIMKAEATEEEIAGVVKEVKKYGLKEDMMKHLEEFIEKI